MAVLSALGAAAIGLVLGIAVHDPLQARAQCLIRAYIEVWRGLPIIVTIFLIYFAFPRLDETIPHLPYTINSLAAFQAATVGLILWGSAQVAEATRGAVQSIRQEQHEAAAALGFGWVGRHVRDPAAGGTQALATDGRAAREHHPEHDDRRAHRRRRSARGGERGRRSGCSLELARRTSSRDLPVRHGVSSSRSRFRSRGWRRTSRSVWPLSRSTRPRRRAPRRGSRGPRRARRA